MGKKVNTFDKLLNSDQPVITKVHNTERNLIHFKDIEGNNIKYTLETLYKIGGDNKLGVISELGSKKEYLIDVDSIKKLGLLGYILNINVTPSDAISNAHNYIKEHSYLKEYTKQDISTVDKYKFMTWLRELKNKYGHIVEVDNTLENIGWSRLEPYGLIYSLGKKVCAVYAKDEFGGDDQLIEINKFIEMASPDNNLGMHSSRSDKKNFHKVLDYFEISCEDYEHICKILGTQYLQGFVKHTNGPYYRCKYEKLNMYVAEYFFDNIYLALPRPEKFETKQWFESALWDPKNCDITRYSDYTYVKLPWNKVNTLWARNHLLSEYDKLHTKAYLNSYKDIAEYILEADKHINNTNMTDRMREIYDSYLKGTFDDNSIKRARIMVTDENIEDDYKDYINWKILYSSLDIEPIKRFMRPATIEDIVDILGETLPNITEYSSDAMNKDIIITDAEVPVEELNTDDMDKFDNFLDYRRKDNMTPREKALINELEKLNTGTCKLPLVCNSIRMCLDLSKLAEDGLYLKTIYTINNKKALGIVNETNGRCSWLIDYISIKNLTKYGYINNQCYSEDNNTLIDHKNKIAYNGYISPMIGDFDQDRQWLFNTYRGILIVDTPMEVVGRLRHKVNGTIFNLNLDLIGLSTHTVVGDYTHSIEEFRDLTSHSKIKGKFCTSVLAENAPKAHNYILINDTEMALMNNTPGITGLGNIKKNSGNQQNTLKTLDITYGISKVKFPNNTKIAVPIPERFSSINAFYGAFGADNINDYDSDTFVIIDCSGIDIHDLKNVITRDFNNLSSGDYDGCINIVDYYTKHKNSTTVQSSVKTSNNIVNNKHSISKQCSYVNNDGSVRFELRYDATADTKMIVLIRDMILGSDNEIVIDSSVVSYRDFLNSTNIDKVTIYNDIQKVIADYNANRKVEDILKELGLHSWII